jgi:hypothetical protein
MSIANIQQDLVKQLALRCNDPFFKDNRQEIYEQALFYIDKRIARRYSILHRYFRFNALITQPAANTDADYVDKQKKINMELSINGFKNEYLVMINDQEYVKEPANFLRILDDSYYYHLYRGQHTIKFNFTPRTQDDDVIIYFLSDPDLLDYNDETTKPVIPAKYEDERIELAMIEVAKIAYPKFQGEKQEKYAKILNTYNDEGFKTELAERKGITRIAPWKYP